MQQVSTAGSNSSSTWEDSMSLLRFLRLGIIAAALLAAVPASAQPICLAAWESWANPDNGTVLLSCPNGGRIYSIDFASYGTPNPVPDDYNPYHPYSQSNSTLEPVCDDLSAISLGECNSAISIDVLEADCLGESSCEVEASNDVFGDPCSGTYKRLYVVATCVPTDANQCKKGGWQAYGIFKNQGDCVSFVKTGGKNEPGKNVK